MPSRPSQERVELLWESFLQGQLENSGAQELLDVMERDAAELRRLRADAALSAGLSYLLGPPRQSRLLIESVQARLKGLKPGTQSRRFTRSVMNRLRARPIRQRRPAKPSRSGLVWFASAAAALALVALLGIYASRSRTSTLPVSVPPPSPLPVDLAQAPQPVHSPAPPVVSQAPVSPAPPSPPTDVAQAPPPSSSPQLPSPPVVAQAPSPSSPPTAPSPPAVKLPPVDPVVATLEAKSGQVSVNGKALALTTPLPLLLHARAELAADALATLTLRDGSTVELSDGATIFLPDPRHGPRVRLEKGQAQVHAQKQVEGQALGLETPYLLAEVVGTRYTARAYNSVSSLEVTEGRVAVSGQPSAPEAKKVFLQAGEEIRAGAGGLTPIFRSAGGRFLEAARLEPEPYAYPVRNTALPEERFNERAIRRLSCTQPAKGEDGGFFSLVWPVKLAADEERFEVWVRIRRLKATHPEQGRPMLCLLAKLGGTTEYRIGQWIVADADQDWVLLSGRLDPNAPVNWVKPDATRIPLRAEQIDHIALRIEYAEMELDLTGITIWKK